MDKQLSLFSLTPIDLPKEDIGLVMTQVRSRCQDCRLGAVLHPNNKGLVWRGNPKARIAVVSEAPGDKEMESGLPLVGKSGDMWERWAEFVGIDTKLGCLITNVVQCFPGSTMIKASGIRQGYRRFYSGPGIRVCTKDNVLTGTPNHPVLTARGWVPLNELRQGDYLIYGDLRRIETTISPDVQYGPSRFDEVFSALGKHWVSSRMVGTSNNFHGDGTDGNIDVVWPSLALGNYGQPPINETSTELPLIFTDDGPSPKSSPGSSDGSFSQGDSILELSARRVVSIPSNPFSVDPGRSCVSNCVALLKTSNIDASLTKAFEDGLISDPGFFRETFKTFTGDITFSQVAEINEVELAEHVYNLETASHIYLAQGFVVSNCQPDKVPTKDNDGNVRMSQRTPAEDEIVSCFGPRCLRILRAMPNLEVVLTLGWVAASTILGVEAKAKTHENRWFGTSILPGRAVYCMVHPAYLVREPTQTKSETVKKGLNQFRNEYLKLGKILPIVQQMEEAEPW